MSALSSGHFAPQLLTVAQALSVLGIGRTHFYGLIAKGDLTPVKLGRRSMIIASELDAFVAALPRGVQQ